MNEIEKNEILQNGRNPKNKKLIFAHAIWRHGKRNPMMTYENSLTKEEDFVHGLGELVHEGMMEHYVLGKRLRERFIEETALVSPVYISKEIHVRSTRVNRTIASAQSHFLSFYSGSVPGRDHPVDEDWPGNFFPVPVHANSDPGDPLILAYGCEKAKKFQKDFIYESSEFRKFIEKNKEFLKELIEKTGHPEYLGVFETNEYCIFKVIGICDAVIQECLLDLPRPSWTDELCEKADYFVDEYYAQIFGLRASPEIQLQAGKIFGGPILWEIINRFKYILGIDRDKIKLKDKIPQKYYVYSAHDTSIIQLFTALGFGKIGFDTVKRPQTADAVTVELWQGEDGSTVVKLFYFRKGCDDPIDMSKMVTGCEDTEEGCSLEDFIKRSDIYKPDEIL